MIRPLIIGHRGAAAVAPENTLAAFKRAMKDGADGIEFDVRLSRDGVPVVIHDVTLKRTGLTQVRVAELSAAELQRIDIGAWFQRHQRSANVDFRGESVPTLKQVFDLFTSQNGLLYLEMKSDGRVGRTLTAEVVRVIAQYSLRERVIVSSFDLPLVHEVKKIDSHIRTAALFEPKLSRPMTLIRRMRLVEQTKDIGADEIALHHSLAGSRAIEYAKQSNLSVVVWTVDNPRWIDRARSMSVDTLITNNPALMLSYRHTSG